MHYGLRVSLALLLLAQVSAAQVSGPASTPRTGPSIEVGGWAVALDPGLGTSRATAVEHVDGKTFVAGAADATHVWLAALGPTGTPVWERWLSVTSAGTPLPVLGGVVSISVSSEALFVICPLRGPGFLDDRYGVFKLTHEGTLVWARQFRNSSNTFIHWSDTEPEATEPHVVATDDGGVFVSFATDFAGIVLQIMRLDSAGTLLWDQMVSAGLFSTFGGYDLVPSEDGGLFLLAKRYRVDTFPLLGRLDPDGAVLWSFLYTSTPGFDLPLGLAATAAGGVIAVGGSQLGPLAWAFETDADGAVLWSRAWSGLAGGELFVPEDVVDLGSEGCAWVGRYEDSGGAGELWLTRALPGGSLETSRILGGSGLERGLSLARAPGRDELVLAGSTAGSFAASGIWMVGVPTHGVVGFPSSGSARDRGRRPTFLPVPLTASARLLFSDPDIANMSVPTVQVLEAFSTLDRQAP